MIQFIKFGMVGLFNSVVNYMIYIWCIKAGLHYVLANLIGFFIVIFIAFLLQRYIVFQEETGTKQSWWKLLMKTYLAYAFTGVILNNLLSVFWLELADISVWCKPFYRLAGKWYYWQDERAFAEYIVPFINLVFTVPINFVINKKWTYQKR